MHVDQHLQRIGHELRSISVGERHIVVVSKHLQCADVLVFDGVRCLEKAPPASIYLVAEHTVKEEEDVFRHTRAVTDEDWLQSAPSKRRRA